MGLGLTESAVDELFGMIKSISDNFRHISKALETIALSLGGIAKHQEDRIVNKNADGVSFPIIGKILGTKDEYVLITSKDSLTKDEKLRKLVDEFRSRRTATFDSKKGGEV